MQDNDAILKEIEEIGQLPLIPKILAVICNTTGMRFAAMAKITSDKWIALAVIDKLGYGLNPGDQMELNETLCSEVKAHEKPVVIDHVELDNKFREHRIPKEFGFQSHISVPIFRGDNSFYGTLCAVDPEPNDLKNEKIAALFVFLSELTSEHLDTVDQLKSSHKDLRKQLKVATTLEGVIQSRTSELKKNVRELARSNQELKDFSYIASHDLQEPLRKIQTYLSIISEKEKNGVPATVQSYLSKVQSAVDRMRRLINDLLAYSIVQTAPNTFERVNLKVLLTEAIDTLSEEILKTQAQIDADVDVEIEGFPFQIRQLFQNLIGNSVKYCSPDRLPLISVTAETITGRAAGSEFEPDRNYCLVTVKDNGIGFDQQYARQIFRVFERLHNKTEYSGTGIGLAIVKKIIENHNGFIRVHGVLGVGAEFRVYLPINVEKNDLVELN